MFLQTLFALSSLVPAITASVPPPGPSGAFSIRSAHYRTSTITIMGGRRFAAEVFTPQSASSESRYPGAIVIATEETRDRAFLIASRMSEIGVTVIMYTQQYDATHKWLVYDAMAAIDSMRRRADVRPDEIGVIAFEEATTVVPDLVRDTTLSFAIAASGEDHGRDLTRRYADAHAATLVVQGVDSLGNASSIARSLSTSGPTLSTTTIQGAGGSIQGSSGVVQATVTQEIGLPKSQSSPAPNVTIWPVPKTQLEQIGEAHSPLGLRVVSWVREQVHVGPVAQPQQAITIH